MKPGKLDLELYRGDSYNWQFRLWQDDAQSLPVDLTGVVAESEIRDKPSGLKIVAMECTVTQPNIIDVKLTAELSATTPAKGVWDLQLTYTDGSVYTPLAGMVSVTADVTDSTYGG